MVPDRQRDNVEENGYHAVDNEKTMFMKWKGFNYIMHGLFVDDMMHTSTSEKMMAKFFNCTAKHSNTPVEI